MLCQNVLFVGESPGSDPLDHPPGEGIAKQVESSLREQGFDPGPIDNWRDCGWSMALTLRDAVLQIALAPATEPKLWIAQVACINQPGFLSRLFGAKVSDRSGELFDVAMALHRALVGAGYLDIRWRIDGFPDGGNSSPEPRRL